MARTSSFSTFIVLVSAVRTGGVQERHQWAPSEPQSDSTPRHSKYRYGYLHPYSNIHHGPFDPVPGSRQPWTLSAWHSVPERPPEVRFPGPSRVAGSRRGRGTSIAWVGDQSMKRAESLGMLYPSHVVGYAVTDSYPSKRPPPPMYLGPIDGEGPEEPGGREIKSVQQQTREGLVVPIFPSPKPPGPFIPPTPPDTTPPVPPPPQSNAPTPVGSSPPGPPKPPSAPPQSDGRTPPLSPPTPKTPSKPKGKGKWGLPGWPKMPGLPSIPSIPSLPSVPKIPSVPSLPSLPSVSTPGLPGMPNLPGVPPLPGIPSPSIPSIPGLPSLTPPASAGSSPGSAPQAPAATTTLDGAPVGPLPANVAPMDSGETVVPLPGPTTTGKVPPSPPLSTPDKLKPPNVVRPAPLPPSSQPVPPIGTPIMAPTTPPGHVDVTPPPTPPPAVTPTIGPPSPIPPSPPTLPPGTAPPTPPQPPGVGPPGVLPFPFLLPLPPFWNKTSRDNRYVSTLTLNTHPKHTP